MKKHKIFLIFLIVGFFLTTFVLAEETKTANSQQINISQTPSFLEEKLNYEWFKIIGIPEPVSRRELIIYLCLFISVFAIIFEIITFSGITEKKWINFFISLIILLLGNYGVNVTYIAMKQIIKFTNFITFFTRAGWIKIVVGLLLIMLIIGIFFLLKWGLSNLRKSVDKERAEDFGSRIKTLGRILNIEAKARGIK